MKFILDKEIAKYKIVIDAVAIAVLLATLQALFDIRRFFFTAKLQAAYQPLIEVLPISAFFAMLGWWCFASCKDHEPLPSEIAARIKPEDKRQITTYALINWFSARRGEIGRICWIIAFFNLLRAFDHSQQSTFCVIALAVIGAIVQDRAKDLWASWNARRSSDPAENFPAGEYRLLNLLSGKPVICKIVRVAQTVLVVQIVYSDNSEGPEFDLPIAAVTKAIRARGSVEELRKALQEGV